jgi:hypothetical protein
MSVASKQCCYESKAEVPKLLHLASPPQDFALIYAPPPPGKTHKILCMEHQ